MLSIVNVGDIIKNRQDVFVVYAVIPIFREDGNRVLKYKQGYFTGKNNKSSIVGYDYYLYSDIKQKTVRHNHSFLKEKIIQKSWNIL